VATLNDLAKRMRKKADEVPEMANKLAIKAATHIVENLAEVTPVDTTLALSNWQIQLNTPVTGTIPARVLGSQGSSYLASATQTVEAAKDELKTKKPGQPIYLSNVVRYIVYLNDGSSTQAPKGFVERAVLIGRLVVRGKI
jgi:hypothetical protein